MNILCTGNPAHTTVASAVKIKFPSADFASRATGFDLRFWDPGSEDFFRDQIKNYNIFLYILVILSVYIYFIYTITLYYVSLYKLNVIRI